MNNNVVDRPEKNRFEMEVGGSVAVAEYDIQGGTIVFESTEVPAEMRGQGIGGALARGALETARERNLKVVPKCPFIRSFIEDNPEFQDLVANE